MSALSSTIDSDQKPDGVRALNARDFIEAARNLARKSRDLMFPSLLEEARKAGIPSDQRLIWIGQNVQNRMEIVMDCYLTGVEETLRRLHGDTEPEPWADDYDHEARITDLLQKYGTAVSANVRKPQTVENTEKSAANIKE